MRIVRYDRKADSRYSKPRWLLNSTPAKAISGNAAGFDAVLEAPRAICSLRVVASEYNLGFDVWLDAADLRALVENEEARRVLKEAIDQKVE